MHLESRLVSISQSTRLHSSGEVLRPVEKSDGSTVVLWSRTLRNIDSRVREQELSWRESRAWDVDSATGYTGLVAEPGTRKRGDPRHGERYGDKERQEGPGAFRCGRHDCKRRPSCFSSSRRAKGVLDSRLVSLWLRQGRMSTTLDLVIPWKYRAMITVKDCSRSCLFCTADIAPST